MFRIKLTALFLGLLTLWILVPRVGCFSLHRNVSESLPHSYYLGVKLKEIERDQYVKFSHFACQIPLAKQIVGIPGDRIFVHDGTVFVNDRYIGTIHEYSRSGMALTPIDPGEIPEGYVFVSAIHTDSFDSRYREFGLVSFSQIEERLCPIF